MDDETPDINNAPQGRPEVVHLGRDYREVESNGIVLHTAKHEMPVERLSPDERERLLASHEKRAAREEAEIEARLFKSKPGSGALPQRHHKSLPDGIVWDDLKMVNCRWCGRTILSPQCTAASKRVEGLACAVYLPKLPGGKIVERLYHSDSVPVYVEFFVCYLCHKL